MIAVLAAGMTLCACASETGPDFAFPSNAAQSAAAGDWDDVDSAVIWGANRAEWVIHKWWSVEPGTRLYELRNPAGRSAQLRIRRTDGSPGDQLSLTASVGPIGDAAAERELIAVVARRLDQLHGVEVAEIK